MPRRSNSPKEASGFKSDRSKRTEQISAAAKAMRAAQETQVERMGTTGDKSGKRGSNANDSAQNSGFVMFSAGASRSRNGKSSQAEEPLTEMTVNLDSDTFANQSSNDDAPQGRSQSDERTSGERDRGRGSRRQQAQPNRLQSRYVKRTITRWRMAGVAAFAVIMLLGGVIGLAFFARPVSSTVENRNLTAFPEFTFSSFADGSYFTDVSLWYADTYPLREPMVSADHWIDAFLGVPTNTGMYGGNVKVDEIPTEEEPEIIREPPAAAPDERPIAEAVQDSIMSGLYVKDGAAYSIYYFSQYAVDTYIAAMNTAAEQLDGHAQVYSIISPANSITLDPEEALSVGGSDQQGALDYIRTRLDDRVTSVEIVDDIIAHRNEYLYFRTDHHWTQLGAHYAYEAFCDEKGIEPTKLDSMRAVDLGIFEGSYFETITSTGGAANSDTIEAHIPNGTNDMTLWDESGAEYPGKIVDEDAINWEPRVKYDAFISGDEAFEVITNPKVTDGSTCLVVKDSYGCAFVPNLVDNYGTIYVVDFREDDTNVCDLALKYEADDVIFVTGAKVSLSDSSAERIYAQIAWPDDHDSDDGSDESDDDSDENAEDGSNESGDSADAKENDEE